MEVMWLTRSVKAPCHVSSAPNKTPKWFSKGTARCLSVRTHPNPNFQSLIHSLTCSVILGKPHVSDVVSLSLTLFSHMDTVLLCIYSLFRNK